jgi:hypothetical protein
VYAIEDYCRILAKNYKIRVSRYGLMVCQKQKKRGFTSLFLFL